jgi:hypothetical protein
MVLGNRAGRKTQTRRVVNRIRGIGHVSSFMPSDTPGYDWMMRDRRMLWNYLRHADVLSRCPYGQPGDILQVRETFWQAYSYPGTLPSGEPEPLARCRGPLVHYAADGNPPDTPNRHYPNGLGGANRFSAPDPYAAWEKRPSIFLPHWAYRNSYKIVEVRLQCIQDITPEDVAAEGLVRLSKDGRTWKWGLPDRDGLPGTDDYGWPWDQWCVDPVTAYLKLWDLLNDERGFGTANRPWVWVITYRDVTTEIWW